MRYWLMKSEPDDVSIDDLASAPETDFEWTGVRNYQARNFMRDGMNPGDLLLFWHSSCAQPGIAGIARITATAGPDSSQFDRNSPYYDPKSTPEAPRWVSVPVRFVAKTRLLTPAMLREQPGLENFQVLRRGNRLSITPVSPDDWQQIMSLLDAT